MMINHMRNLIQKGERNEENFKKKEIIDIIQSTAELIMSKHVTTANVDLRKPYSKSVHEIFPRLSTEMIDAKLGQRMRNIRRPANQNKNTKKTVPNEVTATDNNNGTDFEAFVRKFNISK